MLHKILWAVFFTWLGAVSSPVVADDFCLLLAETYHEQLYCELKSAGQGQKLPSLLDFRRNDELTQALLLKRPAAKLGINVAMPKRRIDPVSPPAAPRAAAVKSHLTAQCQLQGTNLLCGERRYRLVGNVANSALRAGVLALDNKMNIPAEPAEVEAHSVLTAYLTRAYRQYLTKMLEIGLGGSTFSFRKFTYLFEDVTSRGLSFSQRFETMFGFLKQDKQRMSVDVRVPDTELLEVRYCEPLDNRLAVCDGGRRNFLFLGSAPF
ncbi:MAG: hypothetical protein EP334_03335 [Gammaproteobacteria bacterium]|nr:MAG: hypothetical protein EP334_03335 [Gammaproteobacteria bacterium]